MRICKDVRAGQSITLDQKRLGTLIINWDQAVGNPTADAYLYDYSARLTIGFFGNSNATFAQNDILFQRYSDSFKERSYIKKQICNCEIVLCECQVVTICVALAKPVAPGQVSDETIASVNYSQPLVQNNWEFVYLGINFFAYILQKKRD